MVADEKAVLVDVIGVFQGAVDGVVEVFQHLVFGEIAGHDGAAFEAEGAEFGEEFGAGELAFGFDHQGETEPAAGTCFTLDAQVRVVAERGLEERAVAAAAFDQGGEFGQLGLADGA